MRSGNSNGSDNHIVDADRCGDTVKPPAYSASSMAKPRFLISAQSLLNSLIEALVYLVSPQLARTEQDTQLPFIRIRQEGLTMGGAVEGDESPTWLATAMTPLAAAWSINRAYFPSRMARCAVSSI